MLHTFSPNWYRPQCLFITRQFLYYASNYLLYEYHLESRKVTKQICMRQVAISHKINFKDIKIISVIEQKIRSEMQIEQSCKIDRLYVAINQPYIFEIEIKQDSFEVAQIIQLQNNVTVQMIFPKRSGDIVYATTEGNLFCYSLQQSKSEQINTPQIDSKKDRVKDVLIIEQYYLVVYMRGTILVYDNSFSKVWKILHLDPHENVLCCDTIYCSKYQKRFIAILSKIKEQYYLTTFSFEFHEVFPVEFKKKINQIAESLDKINIKIQYPKKFSQKLKQANKAALSIKLVSGKQIIITGKLGEAYTLFLQSISTQKKNTIILKPYSHDQSITEYEVWPDSKHYKQVYCIKAQQDNNTLYFLSTDHNLSIWHVTTHKQKSSIIKHLYSIKFLTTGVSNIFFSDSDPRMVYLLLRDSIIRTFSPLEQGNHYLNEHWRHTKKYKITRVSNHLSQPGVMAMLTNSHQILIYDIYQDRLIKIMEYPKQEQVISISFQKIQIGQPLMHMYCSQKSVEQCQTPINNHQSSYKIQTLFEKDLPDDVILMIQFKSKIMLVGQLNVKILKSVLCFPKDKKLQRLDRCKYWNGNTLLSSHICKKTNKINLSLVQNGNLIHHEQQASINSGRITFRCVPKSKVLHMITYKSSKIVIESFVIDIQDKKLNKSHQVKNVTLQLNIDHVILDHQTYAAAAFNQRDNCFQIFDISSENPVAKIYSYPTKIQCISFYFNDFIIVGSKDQAVKVINYKKLVQTDKKKIKSKNSFNIVNSNSVNSEGKIEQEIIQKQNNQEMEIEQNNAFKGYDEPE